MEQRQKYSTLLREAKNRKVSVIIGPRQVGKTFLLRQLHKKLGGLFLDIDVFSNYKLVVNYEEFLATLKTRGYKPEQKNFFYVFLDEFQRYKDLSLVIKNIYDHHPNIKIFVSGSSSLTIKDAIQDSLAGRKLITYLYPLSFEEFLIFKKRKDLLKRIKSLRGVETKQYSLLVPELFDYLDEFLVYGGYPEVVLTAKERKQSVLESIFDLYIKKDIRDYLQVEKINNVRILVQQLAINNAAVAKYAHYGAVAELDSKTVKNYMEILKETYLISVLKPFFTNKNKEISKPPKIYFIDSGVRNFFVNNFNGTEIRADKGFLLEAFCIGELLKAGEKPENIKYYRTKNETEVDIIIDRVSQLIPVEIKSASRIGKQDHGALRYFMNEYNVDCGYLANSGEIGNIAVNGGKRVALVDYFNLAHYLTLQIK